MYLIVHDSACVLGSQTLKTGHIRWDERAIQAGSEYRAAREAAGRRSAVPRHHRRSPILRDQGRRVWVPVGVREGACGEVGAREGPQVEVPFPESLDGSHRVRLDHGTCWERRLRPTGGICGYAGHSPGSLYHGGARGPSDACRRTRSC